MEGFTNAVRHAHGAMAEPPTVRVEVETRTEPRGVRLCLAIDDQGLPFDLEAAFQELETGEPPAGAEDGEPLPLPVREAHWGLVMLARLRRQHGWSIHYATGPDGANRLVLRSPWA